MQDETTVTWKCKHNFLLSRDLAFNMFVHDCDENSFRTLSDWWRTLKITTHEETSFKPTHKTFHKHAGHQRFWKLQINEDIFKLWNLKCEFSLLAVMQPKADWDENKD